MDRKKTFFKKVYGIEPPLSQNEVKRSHNKYCSDRKGIETWKKLKNKEKYNVSVQSNKNK